MSKNKTHGNTGNKNSQKGLEARSVRFQVRLTPTAVKNLDAMRAERQSRNDALNQILEGHGKIVLDKSGAKKTR